MSLPKEELDAIVAELQSLAGTQIQRITQPSLDELILQLRGPGQTHLLYICLAPPHERLHLLATRPPSLPTPTPFTMALRKDLMGARITALAIVPDDRIVQLSLAHKEQLYTLWIELLPRCANLLLCDADGLLLQTCQPLSSTRHLRRGDAYEPPPPPPTFESPIQPRQHTSLIVDKTGDDPFAWNQAIAALYHEQTERHRFERAQQLALKQRRTERKKLQRLLANLQRDASRCEDAISLEQEGELLKSVLHQIPRGSKSIEVTNYYDPDLAKKTILLDPALSPQHQLDRLFHKLKRARKGLQTLAPRIESTEYRLLELDEELSAITAASSLESLAPWIEAQVAQEGAQSNRKKETKALPYREFTSSDGHRILVGRHSRGNDELTFRVARGNDLWLHARGLPGSHVVVPLTRGGTASSELLIDAATLAAHFSKARDEVHVDIMQTHAKYVRKPKGAPPGQVSVMQDSNIALRLEPKRLQRLLGKLDFAQGSSK